MFSIRFAVFTTCVVLSFYGNVNGKDAIESSLDSQTQCEDYLNFCAECFDKKDDCQRIQRCKETSAKIDCDEDTRSNNPDLSSLCEACSKFQEECKSAPADCTKSNNPFFPIAPSKPKPGKNCKTRDQSCTRVGDPSCCRDLSCEESPSEAGKYKCTFLAYDQNRPSNASTTTKPSGGCRRR